MRPFLLFLFFSLLAAILLLQCSPESTPEQLFARHCGSCHLAPAPASLPKYVWEESVLPEMGARMGIATLGYNPGRNTSAEEFALIQEHGFYPETPTLPYADWEAIQQYVLALAPDSLPAPPRLALDSLRGFLPHSLDVDGKDGSLVSFIGKSADGLSVGDGYGKVTAVILGGSESILASARAPVTHFAPRPTGDLLLEIGNIYPTEASNGRLVRLSGTEPEVIADELHRPVYFLATDLDDDGEEEIVVCEYGNYSGALTLLRRNAEGGYDRSRLSGTPGTVRVVAGDMNGDRRRDLIVLHAQGDEGIDILYQRADGSFDRETVLQFPSVWGSSWFDLTDFDGDGDLDIVTAHGDNADYSNIRKPYHGVRLYLNDGSNHFTEAYFQPLPGATRVVARDFDGDGDTDLAVACNFADYANQPEASFVYLENQGGTDHYFRGQTTPLALDGRWLILEAEDFDGDGDQDLALGSFTLNPSPVSAELAQRWRRGGTDVLYLENTLQH